MVHHKGYDVRLSHRLLKDNFLAVFLLGAVLSTCSLGCGRAYFHQPDIDAVINAPQGTGSVLFECNGPKGATKIIGHFIKIDNQEPIFVENFSKQQVTVATGRHEVRVVTLASDHAQSHRLGQPPEAGKYYEFGKKAEATFWMIDSGAVIARYTPPANDQEAGRLWVL